eukprot:5958520-Amphidinium_carterae.1
MHGYSDLIMVLIAVHLHMLLWLRIHPLHGQCERDHCRCLALAFMPVVATKKSLAEVSAFQ